jgi:hypothetical protein
LCIGLGAAGAFTAKINLETLLASAAVRRFMVPRTACGQTWTDC